jgi:hypothetical protein
VKTITREGRYLRVASPDWDEPLDGIYAADNGGRWNPPGSYGTVYLNRTQSVARLNVERLYVGLPYGPQDLDPDEAPMLVATDVPELDYLDVVADEGIADVGLPHSYPDDATGARVPHVVCQPIGQAAYDAGLPGVASRSAAPGATARDEELAWFERAVILVEQARWAFDDWYWAPA